MRFSAFVALAALALPALAEKPAPELRKSPEFEIVEGSGKKSLLSQYRGKVCVVAFIFTSCPHCQVTSQMYQKIYNDYKGKGFQMLAVAFREETPQTVTMFQQRFGVTFPVGIGQQESVMGFLGIPIMSVDWVVPQIVVIDKKGMIRLQSDKRGTKRELQDEAYMRNFIDSLLKEGTAAAAPGKKGVAPVKKAS